MTADHWGFVVAAYSLAAVVLGAYWRRLCRRDRKFTTLTESKTARATQPKRQR